VLKHAELADRRPDRGNEPASQGAQSAICVRRSALAHSHGHVWVHLNSVIMMIT
jgi:hypothetical protein